MVYNASEYRHRVSRKGSTHMLKQFVYDIDIESGMALGVQVCGDQKIQDFELSLFPEREGAKTAQGGCFCAASAGKTDGGVCRLGIPFGDTVCMSPDDLHEFYKGSRVSAKQLIPANAKYVFQVHFALEKGRRGPFPFFYFRTERALLGFIGHWSRMQRLLQCGVMGTECVVSTQKRKWVIDLDGFMGKLHECGLVAQATWCTLEEAAYVESMARRYAVVVLRCLRDDGFFSGNSACFSVCRRHRAYGSDTSKFSKLSFHITLQVCGYQEAWKEAMKRVAWKINQTRVCTVATNHRSVGVDSWISKEHEALRIAGIDDESIGQNSAGQNMSILFSSKQAKEGEKPQPLFEFGGLFLAELGDALSGVVGERRLELSCLRYDCAKYVFSSMVYIDPLCKTSNNIRRQEEWEEQKQAMEIRDHGGRSGSVGEKRKHIANNNKGDSTKSIKTTAGVLPRGGIGVLPWFAQAVLLDPGRTHVNTTMRSLHASIPRVNGLEFGESGNWSVYCLHLVQPRLCIYRLVNGRKPEVHQHRSNGSRVCVFSRKESGAEGFCTRVKERVFVLCYCHRGGGVKGEMEAHGWRGGEERCVSWPWVEIIEGDVKVMQAIKQE